MKDLDDYLNIVKQGIASHQQKLNAINTDKTLPLLQQHIGSKTVAWTLSSR